MSHATVGADRFVSDEERALYSSASETAPCGPRFHIPSLDGMRAVAIMLVFLSHVGLGHLVPGGLGVTIFFFLSGYLITTLLRREHMRNHAIDLKHFYLRRILRIWPAFYLVLLVGGVLTMLQVLPGQLQLFPTLAQLLHFTNYYSILHGPQGTTVGTGVFWSLAVEEHFYLLFPAVYALLLHRGLNARDQAVALLALCGIVLVWRWVLVTQLGASVDRTYYASDTRLDSLLFGCILAIVYNPVLDGPAANERRVKYWLLPSAVVVLLLSLVYRSDVFRETIRYTVQGIALVPVFIAAITYPKWGVFRALNLKWMRFMGTLSFSFYLLHFTVIEAVSHYAGAATPRWIQAIIGFTVSFALACVVYRFVERPLANLRRKLAAR